MSRYRHYQNRAQPGDAMFATSTVIDFAPIFRTPQLADLTTLVTLRWARHTETKLHAFVLMHHHVHLVLRLGEEWSGSAWMQQMKTKTALAIRTKLSATDRSAMAQQTGLNARSLWKRSFRSIRLETPDLFWQKVRYVHLNPIRAGYCESESDYTWSSKRFWDGGHWNDETGLDLEKMIADFEARLS